MVTQATPADGAPNQPSLGGKIIKTNQDYYSFTGTPNESNGIYYTKATQNKQPITLACGLNSNPKSHALKDLMETYKPFDERNPPVAVPTGKIMIPGNTCYVLQGQCKKRYKDFAQVFSGRDDVEKVQILWINIGSGLKALKELGWYAHMNFEDICIYEDKYEFDPYFINLSKVIPVGQGRVIVDKLEGTTKIDEMNEFALNASLRLVSDNVKAEIAIKMRNSFNEGMYW
ncbi:hypothetical protein BDF19DRAFT_413263 [Syncephalis fuscata]|nr:hypothetical protein BDF19DRAFT_413263 [Syncephalis fuscata]